MGRAETRQDERDELRTRIEKSMLLRAGELGYRHASVQDVLAGYGGYRAQFYQHFTNKQECFSTAYRNEIEGLCRTMLEFIREDRPCETRVVDALTVLAKMVTTEPAVAKALFIEVHVAGGPALAKRQEVVERLSRAIDAACRVPQSRHFPPPVTAEFIVGIVDQAVASALVRAAPEELIEAIPELAIILSEILHSARP